MKTAQQIINKIISEKLILEDTLHHAYKEGYFSDQLTINAQLTTINLILKYAED